jgi:site-specific DNA-methyltransferase (adenine-specific)
VSPEPYYSDSMVTLYHGDMLEVLFDACPTDGADTCVTDPPYGTTSLPWDSWPPEWPLIVAHKTSSMWCFGSMSMFFAHLNDFVAAGWKMAQDIVWEKNAGSGFQSDRFRRVHEHAIHWYRGPWADVRHSVPRIPAQDPSDRRTRRRISPAAPHARDIGRSTFVQDGTRLQRSVIAAPNMRGKAIHPTEKPAAVLAPLIEYSVPRDGLVLDPFAGSGSTLLTARSLGRRAIGIEANEEYCERAATRLAEPDLFGGAA